MLGPAQQKAKGETTSAELNVPDSGVGMLEGGLERTAEAARLCAAFEHSAQALLVLDQELTCLALSAKAEQWFGRLSLEHKSPSPDAEGPLSLRGSQLTEAPTAELRVVEDDSPVLYRAAMQVFANGKSQDLELDALPWGGHDGAYRVHCAPLICKGINDDTRGKAWGVMFLIAEDGERQALRCQLERDNRFETLGRLAGSIAHDFNNLLMGIRGSVALAQQRASSEAENAPLQAADLAAQRAAEMTRQILTFSRGPRFVATRVAAGPIIQEAIALLGYMPDIGRVRAELEPELGTVELSAAALHQVILNLVLNGQDAIRSAGGRGSVCVSAQKFRPATRQNDSAGAGHKWIQISISDTGPGMDADTLSRVFEPFFTTKEHGKGTGLGLATVRHIVEQAGGWIEVESQPSFGSTFRIVLPATFEGVEMIDNNASEIPQKMRHDKVLICDDETRLATLTAGLLEEFGYIPTAVPGGQEALEVLRDSKQRADVLLLDVNLTGGLSATETLNRLQSEGLTLPVILTSGFAAEDVPVALTAHACVSSYLAKPYTVDELVAAIDGAAASLGSGSGDTQ